MQRAIANSTLARLVMVLSSIFVLIQYSWAGLDSVGTLINDSLRQTAKGWRGPYAEKPAPIVTDPFGKRDEVGRRFWTALGGKKYLEACGLRSNQARISYYDEVYAACKVVPDTLDFSPNPTSGGLGSGSPAPGDGAYLINTSVTSTGGGGSSGGGQQSNGAGGAANTNNGNKLTSIHLADWKCRGDLAVTLDFYHNSLENNDYGYGAGWSTSYDLWLAWDHNVAHASAFVHYPDGTGLEYTESSGSYVTPKGFYDDLVHNGNGSWTMTSKSQTQYTFTRNGSSTMYNLTAITDRNGNTITVNRVSGDEDKIDSVVDPTGRTLDYSWSSGELTTIVAPGSRTYTFDVNSGTLDEIEFPTIGGNTYSYLFSYDGNDNITDLTDLGSQTWTFTYSGDKLASETTPESAHGAETTTFTYYTGYTIIDLPISGQSIRHNYDSGGMLKSTVDPAVYGDVYTFNSDNQLTAYRDRRNKFWYMSYDSKGNMTQLTDPESKVWRWTYNAQNDVLTSQSPRQYAATASVTYDYYTTGGRLLETVTDATGKTTDFTYDGYGQVDTVENGDGEVTDYDINNKGEITRVTSPSGAHVDADYDGYSRPDQLWDKAGNETGVTYDTWERPYLVTLPDTNTKSVTYDPNSNILSTTDSRNNTTDFEYDDAGRLLAVVSPRVNPNTSTRYEENYVRDKNGRVTSVTDGNGHTRNYTLAVRGEVWKLALPDNPSDPEIWQYYGTGEVGTYTSPVGYTNDYTLDGRGLVTKVDYPTGTDTTLTYDNDGNLVTMVDGSGTTDWTLDLQGRTTRLEQPQGDLDYTYDDSGRLETMDEDSYGTTSWTRDAYGRVETLTNPLTEDTELDYDSYDRVSRKTFDSGVYELYSYDSLQRLTGVTLKNAGGIQLRTQSYTYDDDSNVATHNLAGTTTTYGYDEESQLIAEDRSGYSADYTYDGNGNRLTRVIAGGVSETYDYDDGDKLESVSWTGHTKTYGYDDAGRTTWEKLDGSYTRQYTYDYDSRVTQIVYGGTTENYAFNGFGTRVSKTVSGTTKDFLRAGVGVTAAVLSDGSAHYTPGVSESRSSTTRFFHAGLSNTDAQSTTGSSVTATRRYDAFGNTDASSGTWNSPFGYAGGFGYQDDGSGLKLLGHRLYDASVGRFVSRDPAKHGANWYGYCGNNPTGRADSNGKKWFFIVKDREWQNLGVNPIFDSTTGVTIMPCGSSPIEGNAVTIGDTIYLPGNVTPEDFLHSPKWTDLYNHEMGHVGEGRRYGPMYLPLYLIEGFLHPFSLIPEYKFSHPMEFEAESIKLGTAPGVRRKPPGSGSGWGDFPINDRWRNVG